MSVVRFTHLGICVADMERSLAFYSSVLGFREVGRFADKNGFSARFLELPGVCLAAVYLERDGVRVELLHFEQPRAVGPAARRPMNQLGITHLSFVVDDLDATIAAVRECGGSVIDATRMEAHSRAIFATDPDGTRLELIERAGDPLAIPGQSSAR